MLGDPKTDKLFSQQPLAACMGLGLSDWEQLIPRLLTNTQRFSKVWTPLLKVSLGSLLCGVEKGGPQASHLLL